MKVQYKNLQNKSDPMNGSEIVDGSRLAQFLESIRSHTPFIARLRADNGFQLVFGVGTNFGCVEYERIDGDLPYLMAVSSHRPIKTGNVEFLLGNTLTPIKARYILSFDELKQIALHFLETGERSDAVTWDSI